MLVVGVGGLGCAAAMTLAGGGVGTIGLADPDRVELSNLHRQLLHTMADIGEAKVASAARKLAGETGGPVVCAHPLEASAVNLPDLVPLYDFVIDATDSPKTKFLLSDAAILFRRPLCHAGAVGLGGQLFTILPGESACLRCVFGEEPNADDAVSCREAGILGPVVAILGALQAHEAIRFLEGRDDLLTDRLLSLDAHRLQFREQRLRRDPACFACGPRARLRSLAASA